MARPRTGNEIGATAGIALRITPQLRESLDELARRNKRSLTDEIRDALEAHVEAQAKVVRLRRSK
jgi:predicted transcriptional regulator